MNIKAISILTLTIMLSACGSDPVSIVKDSYLPIDETLSIEQAFSNRKVCENIDWEEFEDDRGRIVVNYSCEIKIGSYFDEKLEKSVKANEISIQQEKERQEKRMEFEREQIEKYQSSLEVLENLSQEEVDKWEVSRSSYDNPDMKGCGYYSVISYNGPVKEGCQKYLQEKIETSLDTIRSAKEFIVGYAERGNATIEKLQQTKIEKLTEVYQWSFKDIDGEEIPQLIYGGYTISMTNGQEKSEGHKNITLALQALYDNKVKNVVEFGNTNKLYQLF